MQILSLVKELERVGDALPKLEDLSVEVNSHSSELLRALAFQIILSLIAKFALCR